MDYRTHNEEYVDINGTHLQGYVHVSYQKLRKLFGTPTKGDEYKTDVEWMVEFADGTVTTIYNWKNGPAYCGPEGIPVEQNTTWNVGGHSKVALWHLMDLIETTQ